MNNILRRLTKIGGSAAVASALMLSVTMPAHASQVWQIDGADWVWLTSTTYRNGECVFVRGKILSDEARTPFNTLIFPNGTCTTGAGKQCRSTVRFSTVTARFDASTCSWVQ